MQIFAMCRKSITTPKLSKQFNSSFLSMVQQLVHKQSKVKTKSSTKINNKLDKLLCLSELFLGILLIT